MDTKQNPRKNANVAPEQGQATEEPIDIHTAEVKGENVVAMEDEAELARILRLQQDPFRLVMKSDHKPVEQGDPDYHYAWADEADMPDRLEIGFEIVSDERIIAPAQTEESRKKEGCMSVKGLKAIRIPTRRWEIYQKIQQKSIDEDIDGVTNLFSDKVDEATGGLVKTKEHSGGLQYQSTGL